jgi:hypothetical protein
MEGTMSRKDPEKRRKKKEKRVKRRSDYLKDRGLWPMNSPLNPGKTICLGLHGQLDPDPFVVFLGCDPETAKELGFELPNIDHE